MVRLTGKREAYYTDYTGSAEELIAAAKWSYLFQGQRYALAEKTAPGTPALDLPAPQFHQLPSESRSIGQFGETEGERIKR